MNLSLEARYASLCHDLGKGNTPTDILPRHTGHEARGVPLADDLSKRLRAPRACNDLAKLLSYDHTTFYYLPELTAGSVMDVFKRTDALRRPERFLELLQCTQADTRGRGGDFPNHPTPWFEAWQMLLKQVIGRFRNVHIVGNVPPLRWFIRCKLDFFAQCRVSLRRIHARIDEIADQRRRRRLRGLRGGKQRPDPGDVRPDRDKVVDEKPDQRHTDQQRGRLDGLPDDAAHASLRTGSSR